MTHYLFTAIGLSVLALCLSSRFFKISSRKKLYFSVLGLVSWLIPWHLIQIGNDAIQLAMPIATSVPIDTYQVVQASIDNYAPLAHSPWKLSYWLILALGVGVFLFLKDMYISRRYVKSLAGCAYRDDRLITSLLDKNEMASSRYKNTPVWIIPDSNDAFINGLFSPSIWIGEELLKSKNLACVIQHELTHIKNKDSLYLFFITLLNRAFWWNPLVALLALQAKQNIELSCDEQCVENNDTYDLNLAELLLQKVDKHKNDFSLSVFGQRKNFNRLRIERLSAYKTNKKKRTWFLLVIASILAAAVVTTPILAKNFTRDESLQLHYIVIRAGQGENSDTFEFNTPDERFAATMVDALAGLASKLNAKYSFRTVNDGSYHEFFASSAEDFKAFQQVVRGQHLAAMESKELGMLEEYDAREELSYTIKIEELQKNISFVRSGKQNQWITIERGRFTYKFRALMVNDECMVTLGVKHDSGEERNVRLMTGRGQEASFGFGNESDVEGDSFEVAIKFTIDYENVNK